MNSVPLTHCSFYGLCHQIWTKLNKSGAWPEERYTAGACCLNYGQRFPQLLVRGGLVVERNEPLADAWILDIRSGKWKKVSMPHSIFNQLHNIMITNLIVFAIQ